MRWITQFFKDDQADVPSPSTGFHELDAHPVPVLLQGGDLRAARELVNHTAMQTALAYGIPARWLSFEVVTIADDEKAYFQLQVLMNHWDEHLAAHSFAFERAVIKRIRELDVSVGRAVRAVRGVLDTKGNAVNRYDFNSEPAQEGDAIASRLVTLGLQQAVTNGTGSALLSDGLGPLKAAGKTGTSNDGRDSWFAGYTGDHLAVVWVGNDENKTTGLYGATGAMKVWSSLFAKLPTQPLTVSGEGIEWAWLDGTDYATTEDNCPGARRAAFVAGYLPKDHKTCVESSWLDWFKLGEDAPQAQPPTPENQEQ